MVNVENLIDLLTVFVRPTTPPAHVHNFPTLVYYMYFVLFVHSFPGHKEARWRLDDKGPRDISTHEPR